MGSLVVITSDFRPESIALNARLGCVVSLDEKLVSTVSLLVIITLGGNLALDRHPIQGGA